MLKSERIHFMDFARGYAMLSIVLFHALMPIASGVGATAILFGGAGVHAFVLLSGFGLAIATCQKTLSGFYRRRFWRILVPYYVFITGIFLVNQVLPIYPGQGLREYLGHVLLYKMFDESMITSFGYHLWFLSTIIQLYFVFPLLFRVMQRFGALRFFAATCVISALFAVLVIAMGVSDQRVFNSCGIVYLWEFSLGMVLGQRYDSQRKAFWDIPIRRLLPITVAGIVLQAALSIGGGSAGELLNNPASLVGYGGLLILVYRICQQQRLTMVDAGLCWLGGISYELYLVHGVIVTRLLRRFEPITPAAQLAAAVGGIVMSIAAAYALHQLLRRVMRSPARNVVQTPVAERP